MATLLGIDIGRQSVRVARIRTGYRKLAIDGAQEVLLADFPTLVDAVQAAAANLWTRGESVAVNIDGDNVFIRRVDLPPTALKQIGEVLPFELEAQLPFDISEAVFDSKILPRTSPTDPISVLAIVARTESVQERIQTVQAAVTQEPERVDASAFPLANLATVVPELAEPGPIAVMHLDGELSDVVIMVAGQVEFARTVSGGTAGLPASATPLARDLRQTFAAWRAAGGTPPEAVYLTGPGAHLAGAEHFLTVEVGIPVTMLPTIRADSVAPEIKDRLGLFTRAIGLALGLGLRPRGVNLRRGPVAYERGFGFLREKVPLLAGLGAVIVVSFLFSTWMEYRALTQESEILEEALAGATVDVLGEPVRDPDIAEERLSPTRSALDDPMPRMDGFDLMVQISKAVPPDVTHDIEELDFQKGHATIHGIVPTIPDAQQIAATFKAVPCFKEVKIVRTNQVVNEDRQKYVLEFEVKCPTGDEDEKKKKKDSTESSEDDEKPEEKP